MHRTNIMANSNYIVMNGMRRIADIRCRNRLLIYGKTLILIQKLDLMSLRKLAMITVMIMFRGHCILVQELDQSSEIVMIMLITGDCILVPELEQSSEIGNDNCIDD
jgi:hypothetical protein